MAPEQTTRASVAERSLGNRQFTTWSLAALALGLGLGLALHRSSAPWVGTLDGLLRPIGRLWIVALQLTIVPLILSQVVVAVMATERLGRVGITTLAVFLAMLVAAALFALLLTTPLLALYPADPATVSALRASVPVLQATPVELPSARVHPELVWGFIPGVVSRFFLGGNPLPLLLGAVGLALLARHLAGDWRVRFQRSFQQLSNATLRVVGWILLIAPLGVLALTFGLALRTGGKALTLLFAFVLIISTVTVSFTLLLYPVTTLLGRISLRQFARAVAPAQLIAASTRSSLAAFPALVEGGRDLLGLPVAATGFVIPFTIATVKVSRVSTTVVTLLFLAHVLGLPLGVDRLLRFSGTVLLLSFFVAGLPGRGPEANLFPAYLAAGIPLEGVIILEAVDAIPDIFKTILNVTSTMSVAAIVAPRSAGSSDA